MINYDDLEEMLANTDVKYFAFIGDDRDILTGFKGNITNVSSFVAVRKLAKKISVEEYTNTKLRKVEQDDTLVIEQEIKMPDYKFIRLGVFSSMEEVISQAIDEPSMYVFIDSGTTFDSLCKYLSSAEIPFLHIKYNRNGLDLNGKRFSSISSLTSYIMKNYYL